MDSSALNAVFLRVCACVKRTLSKIDPVEATQSELAAAAAAAERRAEVAESNTTTTFFLSYAH